MQPANSNSYRRTLAALLLGVCWAIGSASLQADEPDGFTEPYQSVKVSASEAGTIIGLDVREGSRVSAGQVLVRLDDDLYRSALEIAQANMESTGKLESAVAELELQIDTWQKLVELERRQHASPQEVERALSQKVMAEARLKMVREEMQVRNLEFARAKLQLERRMIVSPMDGIITQVHREKGELVSLADSALVTIVQLNPLAVMFSVRATTARRFRPNETVTVALDELGSTVEGTIEFISPTTDPQSGTTRMRVRLPNPEEKLPCGTPCRLVIADEKEANLAKTSP